MKKRIIALIACIAAALSLLSDTTLAYYSVTDIATNVITSGSISVAVHETTKDGSAFPTGGVAILPGDTVSKIVRFENTGTAPLYLRVKLEKGVKGSALSAESCVSIDLNENNWTYLDGFYYYNTPLNPGHFTENMFTEVYFDGAAIGNDYIGKIFTLSITPYAVQSAHNGTSVFNAQGWPG